MDPRLTEGDLVQLIDSKGRRYQGVLAAGKEFHFHSGIIGHDELIGIPEGITVSSVVASSSRSCARRCRSSC